MVLMSIFVIAYGTSSEFKRTMTNCERVEYMESAHMEGLEYIKGRKAHTWRD